MSPVPEVPADVPAAPAWRETALWLLLLALVAACVQYVFPFPFDADTNYHLAVARLTREHGILQAFPWTPESWLADHYADKELLFHLALVPFAGLDANTAAKLGGILFGTLALWSLFLVLRAEKVPAAGVWTLLALASSGYFLVRFATLRPHLLSLALALAVTWAAARRRTVLLAALCALYPLSYTAFHLPLVLVAIVETARLACRERPSWRVGAAAVGGLALGVLVHPNFPELLSLFWLQNVEVLRIAWARDATFEQGREFLPLGLGNALRHAAVPAALIAAGLWRSLRRRTVVELSFALAAAAFLVLTLLSQRFLEYSAPFAAVAGALALRDLRVRPALFLLAALLWTAALGHKPVVRNASRTGPDLDPRLAEVLRQRIPPGEQVFTCSWFFTGDFLLDLPDRRFLVALDPVFFYARDPARYREWFALAHESRADAVDAVTRRFGARFVLCEKRDAYAPFLSSLTRDPRAEVFAEDPLWIAVQLHSPRSP